MDTATDMGVWKRLAKPFGPEAYREVEFGRKITSIDAYHIQERLTEVFGLEGRGWGVHVEKYEPDSNHMAALGHMWYRMGDEVCQVEDVGDAQVIKSNFAEAMKKARTNLMSKASSRLGVGLSVYQGKGVDDPYLDRAALVGDEMRSEDGLCRMLPDHVTDNMLWQCLKDAGCRKGQVPTLTEYIVALNWVPDGDGLKQLSERHRLFVLLDPVAFLKEFAAWLDARDNKDGE